MRYNFLKRFEFTRSVIQRIRFLCQKYGIGTSRNALLKYTLFLTYNRYTQSEVAALHERINQFSYQPKISIIVPVYNVSAKWLRKCIHSVIGQYYTNWELCLYDDASTNRDTIAELKKWEQRDERIKVAFGKENLHMSLASNRAIALSDGDFIGLLDHDDELAPEALYEVVKVLNTDQALDFIYSDEDKIEIDGTHVEPHFKPDFNLDYFLSTNYICHFSIIRRSLGQSLGWFRHGYEGAQDYDLFLRIIEHTQKIFHIQRVLYHWRKISGSASINLSGKPYAIQASMKALNAYIQRNGIVGKSIWDRDRDTFSIRRAIIHSALVSIIIPFRDNVELLKRCISSILEKTTYPSYEILLISNNSTEPALFSYISDITTSRHNVRLYEYNVPFNYAQINNWASAKARGDYILFLNNDTEVISPEWLSAMVEHIQRQDVGVVGAKLLYPDNTIQHAGLMLGLSGGIAVHAHKKFPPHHHGYFGRIDSIQDMSAVTGACLLTTRQLFDRLGGFDEAHLPVAYNDVDYCLRVRRLGLLVVYTPYAVLRHHESASRGFEDTPEKRVRFQNEVTYMRNAWGPLLERDIYYNKNLTTVRENFDLALPTTETSVFRRLLHLCRRSFQDNRAFLFVVCFVLSYGIFLFRNPDPLLHPAFFAEDGSVILSNLYQFGFLKTIGLLPLNYYTFGQILLAKCALVLNHVVTGGNIFYVPQMFGIVSYAFFAGVSTLHILLFRKEFPPWFHVFLAFALSFFPITNSDFEVVGRILNTGFAFVYIAFLLVIYRAIHILDTWKKILFVDVFLLVCAATNPVVLAVVPLIFFPYVAHIFSKRATLRHVSRIPTFWSAVVLSFFLGFIVFSMAVHAHSMKINGYLDEPLRSESVIEMLGARAVLYPVVYPFYSALNDQWVVGMLLLFFLLMMVVAQKKNYHIYFFGLYLLTINVISLALFRPGLSALFNHYGHYAGPSRHYYGIYLLFIFLALLFCYDLIASKKSFLRTIPLVSLFVLFILGNITVLVYRTVRHSPNTMVPFREATVRALQTNNAICEHLESCNNIIVIPSNPSGWTITLPRSVILRSIEREHK